jgi:hypothetical protein
VIGKNRTAQQQIEKRFLEHCAGNKLRVDQQIDIVGRDACTLTLLHEGRYCNTRDLDKDEMSLIQAFYSCELLNEKHVVADAETKRAAELAISIPVTAKLLVDAHIATLKMYGSGTTRQKVTLIIFADGKKQIITEFATFRPKKAGARWSDKKVTELITKFWEVVNAHYNESWLINPFTNKNGAVVNLGEFLREHMDYHAEQEWHGHDVDSDSEEDVPVYLEKRAIAVRKKEFQAKRAMLAQKRRRVPDASPLHQVQGTQPLPTKKRRIEPEAKSSLPSWFLAKQKQNRMKHN